MFDFDSEKQQAGSQRNVRNVSTEYYGLILVANSGKTATVQRRRILTMSHVVRYVSNECTIAYLL